MQTQNKSGGDLSVKINEVQKVALDGNLDLESKYQKIREIDPKLQTVETVHYRLCIEYSNGVFSKDEYKQIIKSLPLYKAYLPIKPETSNNNNQKVSFPIKKPVAVQGTWSDENLAISVKVKWIGDACGHPCELEMKAGLSITTSTFQMPNYEAVEGFSTAFTHNNKTYSLTVEKIKLEPGYVILVVDEVKT